jgi:hypothetical protein
MELPMNCNRFKFCLALFGLLFFNARCFAQSNNDPADTTVVSSLADSSTNDYEVSGDTTIIKSVYNGNDDTILKWRHTPEFGYMSFLDSLLRKKKSELKMDTFNIAGGSSKQPRKVRMSSSGETNDFLNSLPVKIFFWAIAIFFILFILYRLFIKGGLFDKKAARYDGDAADKEPEKLNEYSAYNDLIYNAELKSDFNQAIRFLYLQSLKKLSDKELILFSPDKTNNNYISELSVKDYQNDFHFLTHNYEYIWYGKFLIDVAKYQQLKSQFISFNKKV